MRYCHHNIKDIIQNTLCKRVSIMPIGNHHLERNLVHYVRTEDGGIYVFKIFLKKNRWNREVAALKLLASSNIRCPKLITYGRFEDGVEWLMTSFFDGYPMNSVYSAISESNKKALYMELGRELAKLHSYNGFSYFGNWDENCEGLDCTKSYKEFFLRHFDSIVSELYRQQLPNADLIKASVEKVYKEIDIINSVTDPCLCHNDYGERNALIKSTKEGWMLEAVIDFEQSMPSDKDKDIAYVCANLSLKDSSYEAAFIEGYKEHGNISDDYYAKRSFYHLYFGLYICSWAYKHAPLHYAEGIALLKKS